jgi:hypothetical protein
VPYTSAQSAAASVRVAKDATTGVITDHNTRLTLAGQRHLVADPADTGLGELRLSGCLATDNAEGLLLLLESKFGIRADRSGAGAILLRSTY